MQSSDCMRNSDGGSRRKLFCRRPTPPRCCSGRCSLQDRSTCARWMVGRRSPQSPSISRLTLPPETIPSCYRRTRHTEFQPHSGRHLVWNGVPLVFGCMWLLVRYANALRDKLQSVLGSWWKFVLFGCTSVIFFCLHQLDSIRALLH